jgi:hypothetical protein
LTVIGRRYNRDMTTKQKCQKCKTKEEHEGYTEAGWYKLTKPDGTNGGLKRLCDGHVDELTDQGFKVEPHLTSDAGRVDD